jgi:hypothetical protein
MPAIFFHWRGCLFVADDNAAHGDMFPADQKLVIRYHIQNLCQSLHCVDSLVIYFNSPTTNDGSMLLWDVDQNGIVSQ